MKNLIAPLVVIFVLFAVIVIGEVRYFARIKPIGVVTVAHHLKKFGNPRLIYRLAYQNCEYYELLGFPGGSRPWFAFPSAAPAYIYDVNGQLVDWCADPGDNPDHRLKWPRLSETPIDLNEIRNILE